MSEETVRLSLPLLQPAQAQKHVTHNEAIARLDSLVQLVLQETGRTSPPASIVMGTAFGIGASATGAWSGRDGEVAIAISGGWDFVVPEPGWQAWDLSTGRAVHWTGTDWDSVTAIAATQNLSSVGINTTADTTNRLSLSGDATLLSHDGAGHQVKVNKSQATDTASLLFQSGFSGRAEMGLAGNDDFSIKVSGDGVSFAEALRFDGATAGVSGEAVMASPTDKTTGRLALSEHAVLAADILGTVAQSGGNPTGTLFESGSGAGGQYLRLADGTQFCWSPELTCTANAAGSALEASDWVFEAPFAATPSITFSLPDVTAFSGITYRQIGLPTVAAGVNLASSIALHAVAGQTLAPGDSVSGVRLFAAGRWF